MTKPLKLLLVEDSEDDALLTLRTLRRSGYDITHQQVQTAAALRAALLAETWDVVLSDYSMPQFSGADALAIVREHYGDLPFLIVSGAIGEERAVEILRAGAHDYVMKDNLTRLPPALERELRDAEVRRARKQAEEQVYKLSRALEQSASLVMITDTTGMIEYVNAAFIQVTGYTQDELIGAHSRIVQSGETPGSVYEAMWRTILSGETWRGEMLNKKKDGTFFWVEVVVSAVRGHGGQITQFLSVQEDITERKNSADALRRSEAQLRALLDATIDIAFLMDANGVFLTMNKTMADSMQQPMEAMIGRNGFDMLYPDVREARYKYFEHVVQTASPVRWQDVSGQSHWDNSIYPILSPDGTVEAFAIYSRDVTAQHQLQDELRRYNNQLEQLVEERTSELRHAKEEIELILNNTRDAIALAQPNGDIRTCNPSFEALFGGLATKNIERILWTLTNEEQIETVGSALVSILYEEVDQRVEAQIDASGKVQDVDMAFLPVRLARPMMTTAEGERPGILISAHDITQIREIERFKARFIADAVHDLATPISGLSMRLYLLKKTPEKLNEHLNALENQVAHLRDLLGDLRTLSQLDRGQFALEKEMCDLNQLVLRVFDTYEPVALGKQQTLELSMDADIPAMLLDARRLERVLVNLISNAVNYTLEGRRIWIRTAYEQDTVSVSVADEGIGISAEELPKVFERFYRTDRARKQQTGGTGLGLAITKEVVELHGGTVSVVSEPEVGSTFTVRLPTVPE